MLYNYILLAIDQPHLKDTNAVNNVGELLMKGGFIMIPIILLSIFSIYLFIERFIYIRKSTVVDDNLIYNILVELRNKQPEGALEHTRNNDTALGRILESGLSQPGKTPKDIENYPRSEWKKIRGILVLLQVLHRCWGLSVPLLG